MAESQDRRVSLDVFPAVVRLPDTSPLNEVRAYIVNDVLEVYQDASPVPTLIWTGQVLSTEGGHIGGWTILTPSGVCTVVPGGGCGCGSKLRSFDPWPGDRRVRVPL